MFPEPLDQIFMDTFLNSFIIVVHNNTNARGEEIDVEEKDSKEPSETVIEFCF